MSKSKENMEDIFRSQFNDYAVEPSAGLWSKVRMKILWKHFFSFKLNHFNLYYLTAALVLGTGALLLITSGTPEITKLSQQSDVKEIMLQDAGTTIPVRSESINEIEKQPVQYQTISIPDKEDNEEAVMQDEELPSDNALQVEIRETKETLPEILPFQETESGGLKTENARIEFAPSRTSGCAPLAVEFTNSSENAEKYQWNFGDGGSSTEENPSYIFDESGEYTVVLRMTGKNGLEYMQQQSIFVFQTPSALFEVEEDANLSGPVYFYNYSKSAQYYEWDFGDMQKSTLTDPIHYYEQAGIYHIKLKVWTENQCFDSLVIFNALKSEENDIHFPNAFTPNFSGPGGGYYNDSDVGNTIFHPKLDGELQEYQLKIFNRMGILLFETTDIQTGWDGYYQQELSPQGVYIWKARGKFSNGQTFVESGDVTLVRKR